MAIDVSSTLTCFGLGCGFLYFVYDKPKAYRYFFAEKWWVYFGILFTIGMALIIVSSITFMQLKPFIESKNMAKANQAIEEIKLWGNSMFALAVAICLLFPVLNKIASVGEKHTQES